MVEDAAPAQVPAAGAEPPTAGAPGLWSLGEHWIQTKGWVFALGVVALGLYLRVSDELGY